MSKCIDLEEQLLERLAPYSAPTALAANRILKALDRLIDEHPEQVPGRTMTRSEYRDILNGAVKVSGYGDDWERGFNTGLVVSGAKVVPDPEPTNAEKLVQLLKEVVPGSGEGISWESAAQKLDKAGVRAPGGDDDQ